MGLFGALNSSVQGTQAQGERIAVTADNIANASTIGYKANSAIFSTLVTRSGTGVGFSSGGVNLNVRALIDKQGLIQSTGRSTDVAISGRGFFAVQDTSGSTLFTRAASFTVNNRGEMVNQSGYKFLAWPLDNEGRKPGALGNVNTTSSESFDSMQLVNTNAVSGTASATTKISLGMNVDAGQAVYQGATAEITFDSSDNNVVSEDNIIVPVSDGTNGMQQGDSFSVTADSLTSNFTYGGIARSRKINSDIFGALNATSTFTAGSALTNGDKFTVTTASSGIVTFTFQATSPNVNIGQFNSLSTLAQAMNNATGITARVPDNGTVLYVASDNANDAVTFANVGSSQLVDKLGFSNVSAAASGVNRFATVKGLSALVQEQSQLSYLINNPSVGASIEIFSKDPLQPLTVAKINNVATINPLSSENGGNGQDTLIVPVSGTSMALGNTITVSDGTNSGTFTYGGFATSTKISSTSIIFGASTTSGTFSNSIVNGDTLTLSNGTNTVTLTYETSGTPDTTSTALEFNSLDTIAASINNSTHFRAKIANNTLYVAAANANLGTTFGGTAEILTELGLSDVSVAPNGTKRFNTLAKLSELVDDITDFSTSVASTTSNSAVTMNASATGARMSISGSDDLIYELGLAKGTVGEGLANEFNLTAGTVAATYDSSDPTINLSKGNIQAHFSRNIRIFDSLGSGHDLKLSFLKIGTNKWATELSSLDTNEIVSSRTDGQIATGTIQFNGDGSLSSVSGTISGDVGITWTNGAQASQIDFNWGTAGLPAGTSGATTIGLTDGLRQFDSSYNVDFVQQNGVSAGQFNGILIDSEGFISASFSNGEVKKIFQIPVTIIADPNSLRELSGNVYATTQASGEGNLKEAGFGGSGVIVSGAVEGSTVDITEELTATIETQSAYNANITVISKINQMSSQLNDRI
jgi:flagellar hook protein FlgE